MTVARTVLLVACSVLAPSLGFAQALHAPGVTAGGRTYEVALPKPSHPWPANAPHGVVHVPATFDARSAYDVIIYLHGWNACARMLAQTGPVECNDGGPRMEGWGLAAEHAAARANSVFVMPQLAWLKRSGAPGAYKTAAQWRALLAEVGKLEHEGERLTESKPRRLIVVAHSAGYETALALLGADVGVEVAAVVLLDSLYKSPEAFARWLLADRSRKLVSVHTGKGGPEKQTKVLERMVRAAEGGASVSLLDGASAFKQPSRLTILRTDVPHRDIPRNMLAPILAGVLR